MDCLFIHGNYPGQFRHLAPLLAEAGHRVIFLTNRADAKDEAQPGVEIRNYTLHRGPSPLHPSLPAEQRECNSAGPLFCENSIELATEGFQPRFVITHAGMGLGSFYKECITPDHSHRLLRVVFPTRHNTASCCQV